MKYSYFVRYSYSIGVNNINRWDAVDITVTATMTAFEKIGAIMVALTSRNSDLSNDKSKLVDIISIQKI